jgi:hypothetical protein
MLSLDKRPCKIGVSINTRRELHGEDPVPAMDIPLVSILLSKEELNTLLDEKNGWDLWFNERKGKPAEPILGGKLKPYAMLQKFKAASVALYVGLKPEMIELEGKLTKLKLEPQIGGLTALSLTVQATPEMVDAARLLEHLDALVDVSIEFGDADEEEDAQDELDLAHVGTPEQERKKAHKREANIQAGISTKPN